MQVSISGFPGDEKTLNRLRIFCEDYTDIGRRLVALGRKDCFGHWTLHMIGEQPADLMPVFVAMGQQFSNAKTPDVDRDNKARVARMTEGLERAGISIKEKNK